MLHLQIEAFYRIIDSYFIVLEKIYIKKGFLEASDRTYEDKMHFHVSCVNWWAMRRVRKYNVRKSFVEIISRFDLFQSKRN